MSAPLRTVRALCLSLLSLLPTGRPVSAQPPLTALPPGAVARLGAARSTSAGWITALTFLPGGKTLAVGYQQGTVRILETATANEVRSWHAHKGAVWSVALSPDGKALATAGEDHVVRLWDPATAKELRRFTGHADVVRSVVFAPKGDVLASGSWDKTVRLWNVSTGKELCTIKGPGGVQGIAFAPDGQTLVTGELNGTVRFWDPATGEERRRPLVQPGAVVCVAYSPDGKTLVTGGGGMRLYEARTMKLRRVLEVGRERISALAFSPDGQRLLAASEQGSSGVWDLTTGRQVHQLERAAGHVHAVAVAPDGKTLATGGFEKVVRLWEVTQGGEIASSKETDRQVTCVAFSPDGKALAWAETRVCRLWEMGGGKPARVIGSSSETIREIVFAPDGKTLAVVGREGGIGLWELGTGKEVRRFRGSPGQLCRVGFSRDGKVLGCTCADGSLHFWQVADGKALPRRLDPADGPIPVAITAELLAGVAGGDLARPLAQWCHAAAAEGLWHFEPGAWPPGDIGLSPDGRLLPALRGVGRLRFWLADEERGLHSISLPPSAGAPVLRLAPDGRSLVSEGNDAAVLLLETLTGQRRRAFTGHVEAVSCVAFSPDGRHLASGGLDGAVFVWDTFRAADGKPHAAELPAVRLVQLWDELGSADASAAYAALCSLAAVPRQAVPFLKGRLPPVRRGGDAEIAQLIVNLDAPRFAVREKATAALAELGDVVVPALRRVLEAGVSLEVTRRIERLLPKLTSRELLPGRLRAIRAVEALERIGTAEVRPLLEALAAGAPQASVTREASAALRRLAPRTGDR